MEGWRYTSHGGTGAYQPWRDRDVPAMEGWRCTSHGWTEMYQPWREGDVPAMEGWRSTSHGGKEMYQPWRDGDVPAMDGWRCTSHGGMEMYQPWRDGDVPAMEGGRCTSHGGREMYQPWREGDAPSMFVSNINHQTHLYPLLDSFSAETFWQPASIEELDWQITMALRVFRYRDTCSYVVLISCQFSAMSSQFTVLCIRSIYRWGKLLLCLYDEKLLVKIMSLTMSD